MGYGVGGLFPHAEGHTQGVTAVAVTPDMGRWIFSGSGSLLASGDHALKMWDIESGECSLSFECNGVINCLAMAPDGRTIAACDQGGRVYFLRMENVALDPPFVTAWEFPLDQEPSKKHPGGSPRKNSPRFLPSVAASAAPVVDSPIRPGQPTSCPDCAKPIKLNPFTINADWHPIAEAWKGEK